MALQLRAQKLNWKTTNCLPFQWKNPNGSCPRSDALQRHQLVALRTASSAHWHMHLCFGMQTILLSHINLQNILFYNVFLRKKNNYLVVVSKTTELYFPRIAPLNSLVIQPWRCVCNCMVSRSNYAKRNWSLLSLASGENCTTPILTKLSSFLPARQFIAGFNQIPVSTTDEFYFGWRESTGWSGRCGPHLVNRKFLLSSATSHWQILTKSK